MRKRTATLAISAAASAVVVVTAMPAFAMAGSITNGGTVNGTSSSVSVTDSVTNKTVTCTSGTAGGTLPNTTTPSNPLGHITSEAFTGCAGAGFTFTSVTVTFPSGGQPFNATGVTTSGVTPGQLTGIKIEAKTTPSTTCDVILSGDSTGANTNGVASGSYTNSSGRLTLNNAVGGGDTLIAKVVSGCTGLASTGDAGKAAGTFIVKNSSSAIPQVNITTFP
jgi:hypothetical protein